jgi:L-ascorbate metabolism protein UlaG (beta-lactamase superfamily)
MNGMLQSVLVLMASAGAAAGAGFPQETVPARPRDVTLTFIGHATLAIGWGDLVIHVDPLTQYADYAKLPKADLVLVTHDHFDHLDPEAIRMVRKPDTEVILSQKAGAKVKGTVMHNGESRSVQGLTVEAVPAYNIRHLRAPGAPFHPKGEGNGYVLTLGSLRLYIAGDTEDIPEMRQLRAIDVAFLPMNLPYTMTPEMVADAARSFRPKILYPYHTGDTDTAKLAKLLAGERGIEVRVRPMR